MHNTSSNVITLSFGRAKRDEATAKEQLTLLINRVVDECYNGRYCDLLSEFALAQLEDRSLQLKDWLQERLGAIEVPHDASIR